VLYRCSGELQVGISLAERGEAVNETQIHKVADSAGFIAALDQSGGSTPKALAQYGVPESAYSTDEKMFDLMHEFRSRIITAPAFGGDRILGAILFEQTMDRDVAGMATPRYLWEHKNVVPFVKVDEGLAAEADGVRLMKPFTKLEDLLDRAVRRQVFGTKMRSFIGRADSGGIAAVLDQQFDYALQILDAGLVPILEPEVDITSTEKAQAEQQLEHGIVERLSSVPDGRQVMLKLSIPTQDDLYLDLIQHPKVLRVVALSGGYSRQEACSRLARNHRLIASFSRALTEGLEQQQTDAEFNRILDASITAIHTASTT
jgi:fructose-bisphosphate aldolase, class I